MAFRVHLAAHLTRFSGPDSELAEPHQVFVLDGWAGALLSVWGGSAVDLDWRLAKISRRLGTLALRATTEDDHLFQLVLLINGERAIRLAHVYDAAESPEATRRCVAVRRSGARDLRSRRERERRPTPTSRRSRKTSKRWRH